MCVVSNIGNQYRQIFPDRWPNWTPPEPFMPMPPNTYPPLEPIKPADVSVDEFNALKKEIEELKKLLLAAKKFDEATGQPDCEMDEKVGFIKKLAELLDVDMKEVF